MTVVPLEAEVVVLEQVVADLGVGSCWETRTLFQVRQPLTGSLTELLSLKVARKSFLLTLAQWVRVNGQSTTQLVSLAATRRKLLL